MLVEVLQSSKIILFCGPVLYSLTVRNIHRNILHWLENDIKFANN